MPEITNAEAISQWSNAPHQEVENFGDEGDFARQYLLNPTIFTLLGDISGKKILDAGGGEGYLCRLLAKKGAIVTGVEPAEIFYDAALKKEQVEKLGITYIQKDLCLLTDFQNTFDYVVANMVFMDIPDYETAIHNCIAALKHGGRLIFSLLHPCFEESGRLWAEKGYVEVREYFQERAIWQSYAYLFHRPLSAYFNLVIREGGIIQRVSEPQLSEEVAQRFHYERDVHVPSYIVISAVKA